MTQIDFFEGEISGIEASKPVRRAAGGKPMPRIYLGVLCGLVFGGLDTALMIPLSFPDKRAAMLGAFIARFGLGFVICNIQLPWPSLAIGLFLGILLSLPDAIITKAMAPILGSGALGGLIIGWLAGRFGR
jgi:hypothetical protein